MKTDQSLNEIMRSIRVEDEVYLDQDGYITLVINGRTIPYHKLLCERALGKPLPPGAEVHHVNGNKRYNAHRNLVVCQDHAYHVLLHERTKALGIKFTKSPELMEDEAQIKLRMTCQTFPTMLNEFSKHTAESSFINRFGDEVIVRNWTMYKVKKSKKHRRSDWMPSAKDLDWSGPW